VSLHFDTPNFKAFELVTDARVQLDEYRNQRDREHLTRAEETLQSALEVDPKYLNAVYFLALTYDLLGKPAEALRRYEDVLAERPPFEAEVLYHFGLAHYHLYYAENLDRAKESFLQVINSGESGRLIAAAHAALAQVYAQKMIPKFPLEISRAELEELADNCETQCREAERLIPMPETADPFWREVKWPCANARGLNRMFRSDFLAGVDAKLEWLNTALEWFQSADRVSPKNWAVICNLGSCEMRLGRWTTETGDTSTAREHFSNARRWFNLVLSELRPNYGFALYEMGRIERLAGYFTEAIDYYRKALEIPDADRNVSTPRVEREIARAEAHSSKFP
jgi:tetratricopeptide (TPR) repeat protein